MNASFRGPIWFGVGLLAVIAVVGAWFYFLQPVEKSLNVNVSLATDAQQVFVGDPFDLSFTVTNDAQSAIASATIEIVLPQNVVSVQSPTQRVVTQFIGTIDAGAVSHQDFQLVATGGQDAVANITGKLTYNTPGSSAQFESDGTMNVAVGQQALTLNVAAPANVFSGQNFPIAVTYLNNTSDTLNNFSVAMQYPPAFTFSGVSSSPVASAGGPTPNGNNAWSLGTVPANGSGTILIMGNLVGSNGLSYPIGALLNETVSGQNYVIANPVATVTLASSPLSLSISLNGVRNYIAKPEDNLNYTISYANNSTVSFQNVLITANLQGGMFDLSSVQTDGSFNSINNTITWNAADDSNLLSLAPGESGSVNFTIRAKNGFPIRLPSDKNYSVAVNARIASPTVPPGTSASSTISLSSITTKFGGGIVLNAKGYHKDPSLPLKIGSSTIAANAGSYPPKINAATQYTIHWLLTNYATDAQNVSISAYLQSGTTCTGSMHAPASTTLSCNSTTGQVTWMVPSIAATTGLTDKPLEAIFQISNTPAVNQLNEDVTLVGNASLIGTDSFTSSSLQSLMQPMTTSLPDDTSIPAYPRAVTQ